MKQSFTRSRLNLKVFVVEFADDDKFENLGRLVEYMPTDDIALLITHNMKGDEPTWVICWLATIVHEEQKVDCYITSHAAALALLQTCSSLDHVAARGMELTIKDRARRIKNG